MKKRSAFTLMELMIVIVILGLLSALVLPNIMGKGDDAKKKLVCIQMQNIEEALKSFKFDNGSFPQTEEGLKALIKNPDEDTYKDFATGGYLDGDNLPRDPWKNHYIYINTDGDIEIISLGSDGKENGKENAKDILLNECKRK
ncbi:MAG: type II secretion system major pseudopilin GspG [Campylobacterota bacterium]|nr:type II secretion system major pseudopilin GspG [Campylobacterota bacterium]